MQSEVKPTLEPTLTEGSGTPPTKFCVCGNKMSGADSHTACIRCLGLEHAKAALAFPATCEHCARFSNKTRKRRRSSLQMICWGSEVDLTDASQPLELTRPDAIEASLLVGPDEAEGGYSESGGESISLGSDEDEDDDYFFPRTASPMVIGGTGLQEGGSEAEHRVA
ncbi:unnamed protein product [Arctogadus glacialis]